VGVSDPVKYASGRLLTPVARFQRVIKALDF
jgi:hypothetical protein